MTVEQLRMTVEQLLERTKKDLVQMAKNEGIDGWKDMSKDELARTLVGVARKLASASRKGSRSVRTAENGHAKPSSTGLDKSRGEIEVMRSETEAPRRPAAIATLDSLRSKTKDELERMARKVGITQWHSLRKEELVRALVKLAQSAAPKGAARDTSDVVQTTALNTRATVAKAQSEGAVRVGASASAVRAGVVRGAARRVDGTRTDDKAEQSKFYSGSAEHGLSSRFQRNLPEAYEHDRIVLMVRDPFWLHVFWELTRKSLDRTEAALGQDWYTSKPILRLLDVRTDDTTSSSETVIRDIPIHGGVTNWYIDVLNPPGSYRVDIGYLTAKGRFFVLARSNVVHTPKPGFSDQIEEKWSALRQDADKIYALSAGFDPNTRPDELHQLFEERLRRPMSSGSLGEYGAGALADSRRGRLHFEIDAELIVYGRANPSAHVMIQDDEVQLRSDGSFTMRYSLPEGRQILPAVAATADGIEVRTIILAVERNTKELEPLLHDGQD